MILGSFDIYLELEKPPSSIRTHILFIRYIEKRFSQSYKATVGADFMEKQVIVDGDTVNLEVIRQFYKKLWDTAGQ